MGESKHRQMKKKFMGSTQTEVFATVHYFQLKTLVICQEAINFNLWFPFEIAV